jgi:hypothetical protein
MRRWDRGRGYNNQPLMKRAINKYGWDNILHEVVFNKLTKEEAEQQEIELISQCQSNNPMFGYNIENGGNAIGKMTDEQKQLMSELAKKRCGAKNPFYGKHHSEETKQKISEIRRLQGGRPHTAESKKKLSESKKGDKNPCYGKHHSEETRKKMSESRSGAKNPMYGKQLSKKQKVALSKANSKPIRCVETDVVYSGARKANELTGIDKTSIGKCCNGRQKTAGGYHWEFV